jgi:autotransporter translocation and assembly factor TamB
VARGTIRLPELPGAGAALSSGVLADVRYDDARARRAQAGRRAGRGLFIATRLQGPLRLRSREADLDVVGQLDATVAGGRLALTGVLEARAGSVALLGHRFRVARARLAFDGDPSAPELHLRVTRPLGPTTLAIVIEGTAQRPEVRLSCDPPIYSEAQLSSLVLAGRPDQDRIAIRDLHRQVTGVLSGLVIRKIQEQLAPSLASGAARPPALPSYAGFLQTPLEIGRFISDRVYVRYTQRFGAQLGRSAVNANEARAEYRLGRGFELDTTFGDEGVGGVYLFWVPSRRD